MEGQVADEIKAERAGRLMQIQQEVVFERNEAIIGRTLPVMIDGYLPEEDIYVGRTYRDTQEIDGSVYVYALGEHMSGDLIDVRISEADFYDLIGDEIDEFTE
jgi:ribosomal protein S12 methylthiotransferase